MYVKLKVRKTYYVMSQAVLNELELKLDDIVSLLDFWLKEPMPTLENKNVPTKDI